MNLGDISEVVSIRFCPQCDSERIEFKEIELHFEKNTFKGKTYVCNDCGNYTRGPKLEKQIENWAKEKGTSFHQFQPTIPQAIHQGLDELAKDHGIKPTAMAKILTTIYLDKVVEIDNYEITRAFILNSKTLKNFKTEKLERISMPVKYTLYRDIKEFSQVWETSGLGSVVSEALIFSISLLKYSSSLIKDITNEIKRIETEIKCLKESTPRFKEKIAEDVFSYAKAA